jgi:hypothetical protein
MKISFWPEKKPLFQYHSLNSLEISVINHATHFFTPYQKNHFTGISYSLSPSILSPEKITSDPYNYLSKSFFF